MSATADPPGPGRPGWLRRAAVLPIRAYSRWISPWTPPSCRFRPTCSAYGLHAVLTHGLLKGGLLGVWRILRCQPFATGGLDPVPAAGRWRPEVGPRARPPGAPRSGEEEGGDGSRPASPPAGRVPRPSEEEKP